jgi:hypothetical protein
MCGSGPWTQAAAASSLRHGAENPHLTPFATIPDLWRSLVGRRRSTPG